MRRMIGSIATQMAVNAQTVAVSAATGSGIDRKGYESCILTGFIGTVVGSPDANTVTFKLQESTALATGYTDIDSASVAVTGTNAKQVITQDLNGVKRYIRAVATPSISGGSGPYLLCGAVLTLGEPRTVPVS